MESVIKWQTGVPKENRIIYLVSLNTGIVKTTTWIDDELGWYKYNREEILAWCPLSEIEPYKELSYGILDCRDKDGDIALYYEKPILDKIEEFWCNAPFGMRLSINWFPEVTGKESSHPNAKCLIFPKGKTTWEGFVPPCKFKDGDIIYTLCKNNIIFISIFKKIEKGYVKTYMDLGLKFYIGDDNILCTVVDIKDQRLATEEEKQKLFDVIKANGYKWNAETKTLEELPKFNVGDRIVHKQGGAPFTITEMTDSCYKGGTRYAILITQQDNFKLVPNKFDISTLKPFDKVLVRDKNIETWCISFFSHCNGEKTYKYSCINGSGYARCIPYEGNEHLLGTTNDCDDFYKY